MPIPYTPPHSPSWRGSLLLSPPLSDAWLGWLNAWLSTVRTPLDVMQADELPDPLRAAVGLPIGSLGRYYTGERPPASALAPHWLSARNRGGQREMPVYAWGRHGCPLRICTAHESQALCVAHGDLPPRRLSPHWGPTNSEPETLALLCAELLAEIDRLAGTRAEGVLSFAPAETSVTVACAFDDGGCYIPDVWMVMRDGVRVPWHAIEPLDVVARGAARMRGIVSAQMSGAGISQAVPFPDPGSAQTSRLIQAAADDMARYSARWHSQLSQYIATPFLPPRGIEP